MNLAQLHGGIRPWLDQSSKPPPHMLNWELPWLESRMMTLTPAWDTRAATRALSSSRVPTAAPTSSFPSASRLGGPICGYRLDCRSWSRVARPTCHASYAPCQDQCQCVCAQQPSNSQFCWAGSIAAFDCCALMKTCLHIAQLCCLQVHSGTPNIPACGLLSLPIYALLESLALKRRTGLWDLIAICLRG